MTTIANRKLRLQLTFQLDQTTEERSANTVADFTSSCRLQIMTFFTVIYI